MPTYLCHGFRWHRPSIRYFVVIQNVDDAAPEWIVARQSPIALLDQFYELFDFLPPCTRPARNLNSPYPHAQDPNSTSNGYTYPRIHSHADQDNKGKLPKLENGTKRNNNGLPNGLSNPSNSSGQGARLMEPDPSVPFNDWSVVKFLEEFDPSDLSVVSGPWAYVADHVVRIDTSASVAEQINLYEARMKAELYRPMSGISEESGRRVSTISNKRVGWFEKLRDQLQRSESIRWYVVVCGDEERDDHGKVEIDEEEGEGARDRTKLQDREQRSSRYSLRGIVENGFEFRLPEFLAPGRVPEPGPKRRREERRMAKQTDNSQPLIPPLPAPIQVVHTEKGVKPKNSKSSGGLRRLFLKRKIYGST